MTADTEPSGRIVETKKDGLPILWTYFPEIPEEAERRVTPWLTIVRWEYDGSGNNGMPSATVNQQMLQLEEILAQIERPKSLIEAYRRVGAGLREYVLYIADRENFLKEFNSRAAAHPRYPIEIRFYEDEAWSELRDLIDDFSDA